MTLYKYRPNCFTGFDDACYEVNTEEELYNLIPDYAVEEAGKYIDKNYARSETKERELIVRGHDRFEILTETSTDYRTYEFAYNPLSGEVKFIKYEGDWKR